MWGDPAQITSAFSHIGGHYLISSLLAKGTTDVEFMRGGELVAHEHVVVPDFDRDLYFAIVPVKDVEPHRTGLIVATLPDGSPFATPW